jgi:CheY-like chemotaxis protein
MIDDNPMEHLIAKALFKHYHLFENSVHIYDCKSAIDYVEKNLQLGASLPDIIFLDLNMPGFNGWDFLEYFPDLQKKLPKQIEVHIFSSSVNKDDCQLPVNYPFVKSYLLKPLNANMLKQFNGASQE